MAEKDNYYLVTYIVEGREVISAIHWRDLSKFRAENEIVSIVMQFRVGGTRYTDNIKQAKDKKMNAMYIPYDGNDFLTGEIVFEGEQFTHLMIQGTDTIAVLPNEDIYPS